MNDTQLERYSRQLLLPNFDIEGQQKLLTARIMIVGLGGLGNIAASYLAAAGVGRLVLIDDDEVELSNLPRQVLYQNDDIGTAKVLAAERQIHKQNPDVDIQAIQQRLDESTLRQQIQNVDLLVDCTDNFLIRQIINKVCFQTKTDLVTGAAIRWQGQLQSFLFSNHSSCCYQCLYPSLNDDQLSCNESGIISPVVGTIGILQALDALKITSGCGSIKHGKLRLFDGFEGQWREINLTQDPDCDVCAK